MGRPRKVVDADVVAAVRVLLRFVGEDPDREGLVDTPDRVRRSLFELTEGYSQDPARILSAQFSDRCDEVVVVRGIRFSSLCEHHMLPFHGTADVGYVPGEKVVGLSKVARLVQCFARRLQVQERLTQQIAGAMQEYLEPRGVAVVVRASHDCMACRGAMQPTAEMVTSAMLGVFMTKPEARAEFLRLAE